MVTISAKLIFDRIDLDLEPDSARVELCSAKSRGISMTNTVRVPGNPPVPQTLNSAINSIVAAAKTAHDLESARRKVTRDKPAGNGRGKDSDVEAGVVQQRDR